MMKIGNHNIDISNRDKIFFPKSGLTKGDLIDYYADLADVMIPHMKRYGVSMHRFPDGIEGQSFYNKNAMDYFPDWIKTVKVPKREGGSFRAPVVDSKATLVFLADQAVLTPHLYLSRIDSLEYPDKMIYDLDPPENSEDYATVRKAALDIRAILRELDLQAWVQTTGSKGYHVVVPLDRKVKFAEVRQFASDVARVLVHRDGEQNYTLEQRKNKRKGRVFLDMLRNAYGATAVAPYSVRAKPEAPVATPLDWSELKDGALPRQWTMTSIRKRLGQKDDPWSGMMGHAQSIKSRREDLDKLLEEVRKAEEE